MANEWFRWWHGTVNDPKFMWVSRRVTQCHGNVVTVWAALLEHASLARDRGSIDGFDASAFDCLLGTDDGVVQQIIDAFVLKGMVENGVLVNWERRQPKREDQGNPGTGAMSAADRKRRQRERDKEREFERHETSRSVTPDKDTDTDTEGKPSDANNASAASPAGFAEFWSAYPRKVGKGAAEKAFRKAKIGKTLLPNVLKAIERARATEQWRKDGGQFIPHPATWLNQVRWEDDPDADRPTGVVPLFAGCE